LEHLTILQKIVWRK